MKTNKFWSILMMLVFALSASVSFSSCGSDDDDVPGGGGASYGGKSPSSVKAVDLGLSVKWANMNVGATFPEDSGDYFAWGETVGKIKFDLSTYKFFMESAGKDKDGFDIERNGYTKYVTKSGASYDGYDGFYDGKLTLELADDAAHANWGGSWRMPTKSELDELRTNCTWELKELNGKHGYKVTSPNGNFIFLPATGHRYIGSLYNSDGWYGYYWSSSLSTNGSGLAFALIIHSERAEWSYGEERTGGLTVRAVCP